MEKSRFKISQNGFSKVANPFRRFLVDRLHSEKRLQDFLKWVCRGATGCEFSLLNHSKTRSLWTY